MASAGRNLTSIGSSTSASKGSRLTTQVCVTRAESSPSTRTPRRHLAMRKLADSRAIAGRPLSLGERRALGCVGLDLELEAVAGQGHRRAPGG